MALMVAPATIRPVSTRPVSRRPMNGSASSVVASMENGSSTCATCLGSGTCFITMRNRAFRSWRGPSSSSSAQPARPEA